MKESNYEEDVNHNFENIHTSILKTLEMLSGEFTIEPFNLKNNLQVVVFFCFVITSLFLFNFILGLVIDDIQNVRKQADFLLLQYQMENSIETSNVTREIQKYIER